MMAFTERGFVWIKTIENKKQVNKEEYVGSRLRDNILEQEIKLEQIEKVFENAFLTKKEDWEIKAEKYLPSDGQLRELRGQQIQKNISDTFRIDSLKVFQENNDPNVIIEISWKNNIGEEQKEEFTYLRTTKEFVTMLEQMKSIKKVKICFGRENIQNILTKSPLGLLAIKGSTYEFGDYIIRFGKQDKQKKIKLQIEYTPSKFEIGGNQNLEEYASKVIKPVLLHIFQNFEEFKDIREATSPRNKETDPITDEPKNTTLSKELMEVKHPFKSTRLFIKAYYDDVFSSQVQYREGQQ